ncbi:MAG: HI0074 family nucleotidyltransferase substrate-binding subunit [Patescibacteria group bacterium]|nr:nucleotidyltransferase substrate binding protein [Patescibacteria group bacterium]MBU1160711.1 nucleotidyltransferase substrate binding protein [Patescibacteria group bacterium]MBU1987853.1 nucleotidyltransferase substrate binding protein [Patescibacteria group bacterium]
MTKLQNLIKDLKKANQRLKEATRTKPTQMNKDATIQRFEFTFELTWKTIQEYVRDQGFDCKSPRNSIREAAKLDIINNPKQWFAFLDNRNLIAHTYNEKIANSIYRNALKFPQEVDKFLKEIS